VTVATLGTARLKTLLQKGKSMGILGCWADHGSLPAFDQGDGGFAAVDPGKHPRDGVPPRRDQPRLAQLAETKATGRRGWNLGKITGS
jgi:hypothetical protein